VNNALVNIIARPSVLNAWSAAAVPVVTARSGSPSRTAIIQYNTVKFTNYRYK